MIDVDVFLMVGVAGVVLLAALFGFAFGHDRGYSVGREAGYQDSEDCHYAKEWHVATLKRARDARYRAKKRGQA